MAYSFRALQGCISSLVNTFRDRVCNGSNPKSTSLEDKVSIWEHVIAPWGDISGMGDSPGADGLLWGLIYIPDDRITSVEESPGGEEE